MPLYAEPADASGASSAAAANTSEDSSPAAPGDWYEVDGANSDPIGEQVLEVPQVVDPGQTTRAGQNGNVDHQDQQASIPDGGDTGDFSAPDQLGSVDDYQSQNSELGTMNGYVVAAPLPPLASRNPIIVNPPPNRPMSGGIPPTVMMIRPGTLGSIPATSPMLTPPRNSGPIPGGWWTPAHR